MSDPWKSEGWQRARQDYHAGRARTTSPQRASGNNHAPKPEPSNGELDAAAVKIDDRNETDAEIKRLAKLTPIEYDRERRSAIRAHHRHARRNLAYQSHHRLPTHVEHNGM